MANVVMEEGEAREVVEIFSEEEVKNICGLNKGKDFIEVICGCTSHRYGDAVGKLRVYLNGDLLISCDCTPGCQEDKLTPAEFEKHSGKEGARKWKNHIWVIVNEKKVPLFKTVLLKYYNQTSKSLNSSNKQNGRVCHRDEFVRCTKCDKLRRFHLRTLEECRVHHDALLCQAWKCSDHPHDRILCDDDEERASRRIYRGCSNSSTCKGCMSCVCFGCEYCRFPDCPCQTCTDFTCNARI